MKSWKIMNDFEKNVINCIIVIVITITIGTTACIVTSLVSNYYITIKRLEEGYVEEVISEYPFRKIWVKKEK